VPEQTELEFRLPNIMEEREHEGLTYLYRFLEVIELDLVRGRVRVSVLADRTKKVKDIASKFNLKSIDG